MSKSKHKFQDYYDDESYEDEFSRARREDQKLKERRKLKKMKNAIRSKDIDALRYYNEEEDYG